MGVSPIDVSGNRQKQKGTSLRKKFQKDQRQKINILQVFLSKFANNSNDTIPTNLLYIFLNFD